MIGSDTRVRVCAFAMTKIWGKRDTRFFRERVGRVAKTAVSRKSRLHREI